ncbi:gliding motility-associated C-terminal domain-containing protein [Pontibacter anaerobius]|uniref:Gliding motility-associated C-terminal domain-containing protein n=1 Tax=Pontibacter anaerobius TaxID=2993940 RepID=A0ABT3RFQ3_9BACT|nr:gliding motility-associated C-terminal domain-containing protein [Pontibacter anaerobius]MCX2740233.1 gliding motility-associated C-terminal domain-containing protein [Pontibacter anaerobius]
MRYFLQLYLALACCLTGGAALAQGQANIWYFGNGGAGLDFNLRPPGVLTGGALLASEGVATMADSTGRLLFYTNGERIWNREHRVMANGSDLAGHLSARQGVVIVPQPGSKTRYFVFTTDALENRFAKGLRYSVVDMARQSGLGEVTTRNTLLHPLAEENLAATGACGCSNSGRYWVAADRQDRPGILYAYRVDAGGVNPQPVETLLPGVASITFLKFSPAGDRVAFTGLTDSDASVIGIADFDAATGRFSELRLIPVVSRDYHRAVEFSGDGKLLYFTTWSSPQLTQYDLSHASAGEMARTALPLVQRPVYSLNSPQLASDGKIYLSAYDGKQTSMAVLEHPNLKGPASLFRQDAFPGIGAYMLPNFVTSLLYRNELLAQRADAGPDRDVCANEPVRLGSAPDGRLRYSWSTGAHLSDSTVASPEFRYVGAVDRKKTLQYVLTVSDGPCTRRDTVEVTVHPLPRAAISGPRSVCPMVEGVVYQTDAAQGHTFRWRVRGGTVRSGQGTAAVTVDWGPTNAAAWVEVAPVNGIGCVGPPARMPVRVNVELETETPQGPQSVCLNQRAGNAYHVSPASGSVYTWGALGGRVVSGQGSARAVVDWDGTGTKKLWVQEQSVTVDTVCYGVSDTLRVNVFQDPTAIAIDFVTINDEEGTESLVQWRVDGALSAGGATSLQRRAEGSPVWAEVASVPNTRRSRADSGLRGREEVYAYRVVARNGCGEEVASDVHRTIRLRGEADAGEKTLTLRWSPYEGWEEGVLRYQVWRRLDGQADYTLLQEVDGTTLSLPGLNATEGFTHSYRVKAMAAGKPWESWSNSTELSFEHALNIPNIFSPNGDGMNDTFFIPQIELYPDNELVVVNRLGREVFRRSDYRGNWTGGDLSAGVYYYSLYVGKLGRTLKGWVEIVR